MKGRGTILNFHQKRRIHVFYETVVASSLDQALLKLMLLNGLGAMRANVTFVEFDEELNEDPALFI